MHGFTGYNLKDSKTGEGARAKAWRSVNEAPSGRIARHEPARQATFKPGEAGGTYHKLFEVELRQLMLPQEVSIELSPQMFEDCRKTLEDLCATLNKLVQPKFTQAGDADKYNALAGLIHYLKSLSPDGAAQLFDLVNGPHSTVFALPNNAGELRRDLDTVTRWNELSLQFQFDRPEPPHRSVSASLAKKQAWSDTSAREHAIATFNMFFQRVTCEMPHEILLKVPEGLKSDGSTSKLDLLLEGCPTTGTWQEAMCDTEYSEDNKTICEIRNVCKELLPHPAKGLTLLVRQYGLFSSWSDRKKQNLIFASSNRQTLDDLIELGHFKPLDPSMLFGRQDVTSYSLKEKRSLALQLGYHLLDFFDYHLCSKNVSFFIPEGVKAQHRSPYLSFFASSSQSPPIRVFQMGHPVLLSAAKMLLEIDCGKSIPMDLSLKHADNIGTWAELLACVEKLEAERDDSYLQAIRGCLLVHRQIADSLRRSDGSEKDADVRIRKQIYHEVVQKLELGLEESTPRPRHKRARSESPPPVMAGHDVSKGTRRDLMLAASESAPASSASWDATLTMQQPPPKKHRSPGLGPRGYRGLSKGSTPPLNHMHISSPKYMNGGGDSGAAVMDSTVGAEESQPTQMRALSPEVSNLSSLDLSSSFIRPSYREEFEVGIICALALEYDAVTYIFDEFWDEAGDNYDKATGDPNIYTTGRIGKYNVVLARLPQMGKGQAAAAAASMRSSYSHLKLVLLVGVCGGVPNGTESELVLGDVVISKTIVQYDFGRQYSDMFRRKSTIEDNLGYQSKDVRNLIATFETDRGIDQLETRTAHFLEQLQAKVNQTKRRGKYKYPGAAKDRLFESAYRHKHHVSPVCICSECHGDSDPVCERALSATCDELGCNSGRLISRDRLLVNADSAWQPTVHVGSIASGDTVMKSSIDRDRLMKEADVIALEMEGAGVWDEFPCAVVKGVCDYSDSHKNKGWQNFAAATAASAAKAILECYIQTDKPDGNTRRRRTQDVMSVGPLTEHPAWVHGEVTKYHT